MKKGVMWLALGLLLTLAACGKGPRTEVKQTNESAAVLYRDYALHALPNRNVIAEYMLTERAIPGLWTAVGGQVFSVGERIKGQIEWRDPVLCVAGKILPFGRSVGGVGVMSAVSVGDAFYYTYAYGSETHRSHVGRITVVDGQPRQHESPGFVSQDLFVERWGKEVRIIRGHYKEFNEWENGTEIARVDVANKTRFRLVDAAGAEMTPAPEPTEPAIDAAVRRTKAR